MSRHSFYLQAPEGSLNLFSYSANIIYSLLRYSVHLPHTIAITALSGNVVRVGVEPLYSRWMLSSFGAEHVYQYHCTKHYALSTHSLMEIECSTLFENKEFSCEHICLIYSLLFFSQSEPFSFETHRQQTKARVDTTSEETTRVKRHLKCVSANLFKHNHVVPHHSRTACDFGKKY